MVYPDGLERSWADGRGAIVGASLSESVAANFHPARPVSVLILQGSEDPRVPLAGGALGPQGAGGFVLSYDAAVRKFVERDRCPADPKKEHLPDKVNDGTTIDATVYFSCAEGSEVRGYVENGGGHAWPGGTQYLPAVFIGAPTRNVDGSELIWDFPSRHSR